MTLILFRPAEKTLLALDGTLLTLYYIHLYIYNLIA